ncbi:MAG TPA: EamA family transporter [Chloroflexota bacterium]|jgi:inner membrane transporter RhtA|nr:EamA family transporter [Chloroflexota bacterium]
MSVTPTAHREPVLTSQLLGELPAPAASGVQRLREAAGSAPPTGLVLLSILSVQLGAAGAKSLFHALGPEGTVCLRISFAALVLLAVWRPRLRGHTRAAYGSVLLFGLVIACMNACFYAAIARLPLGLAVTVEFIGPLGVAVAGSRRALDLLWGLLAAGGVLLLAPIGHTAIDPLGLLLALIAGGFWAAYILLNVRVGRAFDGSTGLALAMGIAALVALPLGVLSSGTALLAPGLLFAGVAVAVLSTVIPFSLEHVALKRLPARRFGVLMSVEPAVAALVGFLLLGEGLGLRGLLALACVSLASVGSAQKRPENSDRQ